MNTLIAAALNVTLMELKLLFRLKQLSFKLMLLANEPIIRVKPEEQKLRVILLEYMDEK